MADVSSLTSMFASMGPELANHLWQSTAFAVVAAGLALALKKNQARARYWIWMSASVKLLLPFALLAGLASQWAQPRLTTARPAHTRIAVALENVSEPFSAQAASKVRPLTTARDASPTHDSQAIQDGAPTEVAVTVAPEIPRASGILARVLPAVPLVCGAIWLAGFLTVLALWSARWLRVAHAMRQAIPLAEGREIAALRRTEIAAGVRRPIELRESASAMEPGVFGILRPVLAWPAGISARLNDAQLEAILAHEVCHVRRRDNLTAALHMLVEAVFWFHPMVWWMGARLVEERERACDEEVLQLGRHPRVYAESILKVCEFCVQSPLECVSGVTGADLKQRVLEIVTQRAVHKLTWSKKLLLAAVAMLVAAVPIVLGQAKASRRVAASLAFAPAPLRVPSATAIAEEPTPSSGEIAAMESPMLSAIEPSAPAQTPAAQAPSATFSIPNVGAEEEELAGTIVFDVASIRVNSDSSIPATFEIPADGDGFTMLNRPMRDLIRFAYNTTSGVNFHFANEPAWINQVKWDIRAKVASDNLATWQKLSPAGKRLALRRFVVDYLKLSFHKDTASYTYYNLVVDKRGPKMDLAKPDDGFQTPHGLTVPPLSVVWTGPGEIAGHAATMAQLSVVLSGHTPWVVHDETGLKEAYNFSITYAPSSVDDPRARALGVPAGYMMQDDGPSLFTAVQQLGLKLVATRGPLEGIVVDHIERPPTN